MSRFWERVACIIMLFGGVIAVLDSRGEHLDIEGLMGLWLVTTALAFLFLPDSEAS